ncbi:MAG: hypothetical protein LBR31_02530 [Desulfovibrio sp.]|jgi:membrane protein implicated in regulation of membrane protease activity|nr:hypothetical protein [Desulfovibrio sp.]
MADSASAVPHEPWYAGRHKDAVLYLLVAVLLIELAVGGVAFFYGLIHAAPETPGGPPMARFPWLGWAIAALLCPVGLLLIVHLTGLWLSRTLNRDERSRESSGEVPERLRRFYAIVQNTPTVVMLVCILLLGAILVFVDGALSGLISLGGQLLIYTPWLAGSAAALLTGCYVTHRFFIYRHQRMEREYDYRREVLERTGIVLLDKDSMRLAPGTNPTELPNAMPHALPAALDVENLSTDNGQGIRQEQASPPDGPNRSRPER